MFAYYGRLALRSLASTPGLTALMVLAIGLGIGVCVTILTVYHGVSSNPAVVEERSGLFGHDG